MKKKTPLKDRQEKAIKKQKKEIYDLHVQRAEELVSLYAQVEIVRALKEMTSEYPFIQNNALVLTRIIMPLQYNAMDKKFVNVILTKEEYKEDLLYPITHTDTTNFSDDAKKVVAEFKAEIEKWCDDVFDRVIVFERKDNINEH